MCKHSGLTLGVIAMILALLAIPASLHAATLTWVGNNSADLLTADNWNPAQAPVNGDTWVFEAAGTAGTSLTLGSSRNINGLSFSSGASAYAFSGGGVYTIASGGLTNSSGTTQTFDSTVRYNTASTFTANSPVIFNGSFYGNSQIDLNSNVTFNGNISGGSTALLLRFGGGIVTLNGSNNDGLQSITLNRAQRVNIGSATGLASATTVTMGSDRADAQSGAVLANTSGTPLTTGASLAVRSGTSLAASGLNFGFGDAAHTAANSMTFNGTAAIDADLGRTITLNGTGLNVTSASVWNNTVTGNRTLVVNGAGNTFGIGGIAIGATDETNSIAVTIGGSGNLTIAGGVTAGGGTGARGLTLNKTSGLGTVIIGGASDYTGATTIQNGTLQVGNGGATGSLDPSSSIGVSSGATLAFNRSNTITQGTDFNSVIGGAGNLVQAGSGTLVLNGANTYSGTTSIHAGTLALGAAGSFADSSAIIVGNAGSAGAVLDLTAKTEAFSIGAGQLLGGGGTVRLASSGTLNVLGTFSPGNSPGLFTYDAGTTVLSGTTIMELLGTSRATSPSHGAGFYDAVDIVNNGILQFGGLLTLEFSSLFDNNTTFDLFTPEAGSALAGNFSGVNVGGSFYTGLSWNETGGVWKSSNTIGGQSLEFSSVTGQLVIVPEPGAIALAGIGLALAGWAARRRT